MRPRRRSAEAAAVKEEAERISEAIFSKETREHMVRAGTEMMLAMDSMIPRDKIPRTSSSTISPPSGRRLLMIGRPSGRPAQSGKGHGEQARGDAGAGPQEDRAGVITRPFEDEEVSAILA